MKKDIIVIKQLFWKQLLLTLASILMVAVSCVIVGDDFIVLKIIGVIGILFFGAALLLSAKRLFIPKDILVINENGFIDNSTGVSSGQLVCWNTVESISIKKVFQEQYICVEIESPNEYMNHLTWIQKCSTRINRALSYGSIQISLSSTTANYDEVIQTMMEYWSSGRTK